MAAGADRRAGGYHARGDTLSRARTWHCDQHLVALAVLRRARNQRQKKAFARRSSCAPTWRRLARSGSANRRRLIPTGSFSSTRPDPPDDQAFDFIHIETISSRSSIHDWTIRFVNDSISENTRKAYLSDLGEFERWGGSIPSSAETVAAYLAVSAERLAVASLVRHVAS